MDFYARIFIFRFHLEQKQKGFLLQLQENIKEIHIFSDMKIN